MAGSKHFTWPHPPPPKSAEFHPVRRHRGELMIPRQAGTGRTTVGSRLNGAKAERGCQSVGGTEAPTPPPTHTRVLYSLHLISRATTRQQELTCWQKHTDEECVCWATFSPRQDTEVGGGAFSDLRASTEPTQSDTHILADREETMSLVEHHLDDLDEAPSLWNILWLTV